MTQIASRPTTPPDTLEPAWDIATLFPPQGQWSESDYLDLTDSTNRLVELVDGKMEVLEMPKSSHQLIVQYLSNLLLAFATKHDLGRVLFAAIRVKLRPRTFREPDVVFMRKEHIDRAAEDYWEGADLVMEIVSRDAKSHERDWEKKRADYALAGIPEYWIVDPQLRKIVVLRLENGAYVTHSEAGETGELRSALLDGFTARAQDVWASAKL